ncbi:uncharacterized protein EAE98_000238 [Botrytis deweyae]|uniref:Uncharacterized protein n=1 Tax=Botrytis deweyae TaxID=2478750 RepID=A0ABQ7J249_9HELO|nr:uncharacterized protein EAE98_000238 [Botrytis deweyae]KAF7940111.1 hypothetical protein EAE98_000238 [Botrytis deweyae]
MCHQIFGHCRPDVLMELYLYFCRCSELERWVETEEEEKEGLTTRKFTNGILGMKAVRLLLQTISTSPHLNLPHSPYHDLCANPLADFRTV